MAPPFASVRQHTLPPGDIGPEGGGDPPLPHSGTCDESGQPRRGVVWVLQWALCLATVAAALLVMARFAVLMQAEAGLAEAARAGVLEASLPKATHLSVCRVARARLAQRGWPNAEPVVVLSRNGRPISGLCRAQPEDRFALTVILPSRDVLPEWLRLLNGWMADDEALLLASSGR